MSIPIPSPRRRGFTLLELIVVITIIGLLSSVVVVATKNLPRRARALKVQQDLRQILTAARTIHIDTGRYPDTILEMVGTRGLVSLETYPRDPWGGDYLFEVFDDEPRATCLGSDGQPGGAEGEAVDIVMPARDASA
jgi:general secretion pathway protein G